MASRRRYAAGGHMNPGKIQVRLYWRFQTRQPPRRMRCFIVNALAWMNMPGHMEWIVILVHCTVDLRQSAAGVARSVGKSLTEFKKGINEAKESTDELVRRR